MNSKKAELSINVIIAAVIGLLVLVVLIAIFTTTTQKTTENIGSCTTKDGICANLLGGECGGNNPVSLIVSGDCQSASPKGLCCLKAEN